MDLADKVIEANQQEVIQKQSGDIAPDGYYTDDLGFWVEQDIRRHKMRFAEYVYFRCRRMNPGLNVREGSRLYNRGSLVRRDPLTIASLARLPEMLQKPISNWVFDKLVEESPKLDRTKIEIKPGWLWDMEKCEIIKVGEKGE